MRHWEAVECAYSVRATAAAASTYVPEEWLSSARPTVPTSDGEVAVVAFLRLGYFLLALSGRARSLPARGRI